MRRQPLLVFPIDKIVGLFVMVFPIKLPNAVPRVLVIVPVVILGLGSRFRIHAIRDEIFPVVEFLKGLVWFGLIVMMF